MVVSNPVTTRIDGSLRIRVENFKLNAVVILDSYFIPFMDECRASLSGATILLPFMLIAATCKWKLPVEMAINLSCIRS